MKEKRPYNNRFTIGIENTIMFNLLPKSLLYKIYMCMNNLFF